MRLKIVITALMASCALLLTSCTGGESFDPTSTSDPNPDATVTVRLALEPSNLDIRHTSGAALDQALVDNVYQGLVTRDGDDNNAIVPALADEWEISPDGLTYTFTLHEGVTFHDGSTLTANDVVSSLQAAKDDPSIQGHPDLQDVSAIASPDATTVVIALAQPNIDLLFALTGRAGLVFKDGDSTNFNTQGNGTGPFTVSSWKQGDSLTLSRFDDYWGTPAGVAKIVLVYIPDQTAATNAALSGDVDVVTEVDPQLASQFEDDGSFTLESGQTTDKGVLAFNNARAPLDDLRVREALRLAIDHDSLVETLGSGQTLYGPIPQLDPGYEDLSDLVSFDPDRARELLAEAGVQDLSLTLTIPNVYDVTIATYLISAFKDIGVELFVDSVDFPVWLQDVYTNKDYDLSFVRHVEARDFGNWANPDYYFGYDNPEVQSLYQQSLATADTAQSAELLAQAARIVSEEDAADWLFISTPITAVGTQVSGFPMNSLNVRLPLVKVTTSAQ